MKTTFLVSAAAALASLSLATADAQTHRHENPLTVLGEANRIARQGPAPAAFERARQVHAYEPGAIYELYANPAFVSAILLEPGERLSEAAAGDTRRWMVSEAASQTQGEARTIVLVRPNEAGLRTNLVIITDRRVYLIEAASQAGRTYSAEIAWTYPQTADQPSADLARLNTHYRVRTMRGRRPAWAPAEVYDDGRKTWIVFPAGAAASELPPVFAAGAEGPELVNFRVRQSEGGAVRYEIDGVYDALELRLGLRPPVVVRIERASQPPRSRAPGRRR